MKTDVSQLVQTMGRVDRGTTRKELEVILGHSVSDFEYRVFRRDVAELQRDENATRGLVVKCY